MLEAVNKDEEVWVTELAVVERLWYTSSGCTARGNQSNDLSILWISFQ